MIGGALAMYNLRSSFTVGVLASLCSTVALTQTPPSEPLVLQAKIPLGEVRGRIDHLAVDLARRRLFVAELGNDTVGVVDLKDRRVALRLTGLKEPQGIGYVASTDTLYVANAFDGTVRVFQGPDLSPTGRIELGDDADNVRVDETAHEVWVGYGGGALAVIDTASHRKIADVPLKAHPESFRLETPGQRIFVNVPDAHEIAVVDRTARKQIASWPNGPLSANFPLALDPARQRVVSIFRHPPTLAAFQAQDGKRIATVETCGDSDDAYIDGKRNLVYLICGAGYVDVLEVRGRTYQRVARVATLSGARTGLFVPELDRLFVAARAHGSEPAAVWEFRPAN
jgi:DNA-binding beta-propeller fold protein YncE